MLSIMKQAIEKFPPEEHALAAAPDESQNLLNVIPVDLIVLQVAAWLDLESLHMFMQVCRYTFHNLNEDASLWASHLRNAGLVPNQGEGGVEHKARFKEVATLVPHRTFYNTELNLTTPLDFPQAKPFMKRLWLCEIH